MSQALEKPERFEAPHVCVPQGRINAHGPAIARPLHSARVETEPSLSLLLLQVHVHVNNVGKSFQDWRCLEFISETFIKTRAECTSVITVIKNPKV